MNVSQHARFSVLLSLSLLSASWCGSALAQDQPPPPPQAEAAPQGGARSSYTEQSPTQLQQLVAPIALYPDQLVAQILAASTFPEQIVEADRWAQANPSLKGAALGQAVDQQPWDSSVKALTAFPAVLGNMDKNLSWTSSLGDAYYNQPQDVMNAVQAMRGRAQQAGNLKSTPQQAVADQDSTISIEPTNPDVVYVPAYDPWLVYGDLIPEWPGWYPYPGIWFGGPYLSFGVGFGIGFLGGFGWGWHNWGFDWHRRAVLYNHSPYFSRSTTFYNRANFYRGAGGDRGAGYRGAGGTRGFDAARGAGGARTEPGGARAGGFNGGAAGRPFGEDHAAMRGFTPSHGDSGMRSGAFSGFDHGGGEVRGFSQRGSASFGGGGARGGGGGGHGGGGGGHR
ncbi:MAG TPA: DUF3300 domain-containing protein [Steroidobacteraceae bacterium]|nr:DUF3300 domain-containing protein [Steroidobacteraceae bacterium]